MYMYVFIYSLTYKDLFIDIHMALRREALLQLHAQAMHLYPKLPVFGRQVLVTRLASLPLSLPGLRGFGRKLLQGNREAGNYHVSLFPLPIYMYI